MSCVHVDTSGKLPLPPVEWKPTGRADVAKIQCSGPETFITYTWFYCSHCGAPGFKRGASDVVYTWEPNHMEIVK